MTDVDNQLRSLLQQFQKTPHSVSDLEKIDQELNKLSAQYPHNFKLLLFYNEFRISCCGKLPKTRPQILLGGTIENEYPHLHSYPLLRVADVICISARLKPLSYYSVINCTPFTPFFEILKKIPPGFVPDFFWDNQMEHMHLIPPGIEIAPFPIVASVCHTYLHQSIEHICELFDMVIPNSKFYGDNLRKKYPQKIFDLPFGLNWASFDHFIQPNWNKSIDVCLTFQTSNSPIFYNIRNRVIELMRKFKEKYGHRFSIEICSPLPQEQYVEMLKKSRIAINVTGVHGPYNYRTIESMCTGAMVFQYDWDDSFFKNEFSELFLDGIHGVSFNFDNFETKLLYYLENPEQTDKIAHEAYTFLKENYNYPKLYQKLFLLVQSLQIELPRKIQNYDAYHHLDMTYYYQNNDMVNLLSFGVISEFEQISWIKFNNLMVFSTTLLEGSPGYQFLIAFASKTLALLNKADIWTLSCELHRQALVNAPYEHVWIIEWNFLLISIELEKADRNAIEKMILRLESEKPLPYDESKIIFKYYINSNRYPQYMLNTGIEFIKLNLEIIKVIDNPEKRAQLFHQYALKACRYLLDFF